jgi:hypothetical protein
MGGRAQFSTRNRLISIRSIATLFQTVVFSLSRPIFCIYQPIVESVAFNFNWRSVSELLGFWFTFGEVG